MHTVPGVNLGPMWFEKLPRPQTEKLCSTNSSFIKENF
jgi:hypothetical protein